MSDLVAVPRYREFVLIQPCGHGWVVMDSDGSGGPVWCDLCRDIIWVSTGTMTAWRR